MGKKVKDVYRATNSIGVNKVMLDTGKLPSGFYTIQMTAKDKNMNKRLFISH